jgi:hypothetical protein
MGGELSDLLCERHERTVGADNCVKFEKRTLQIPADKHRCHYVKAKVDRVVGKFAAGGPIVDGPIASLLSAKRAMVMSRTGITRISPTGTSTAFGKW